MYACGLCISEAANLEVTAIDGVNGLVRVIGKGNKERQVPQRSNHAGSAVAHLPPRCPRRWH